MNFVEKNFATEPISIIFAEFNLAAKIAKINSAIIFGLKVTRDGLLNYFPMKPAAVCQFWYVNFLIFGEGTQKGAL